jgi:hypothetical protein
MLLHSKSLKVVVFQKRSKHIDIRYHYSLEKVHDGFINVKHAPGDDQNFADLFRKPVA